MHSIDDLSQHTGLLSAKELAEFLGRSRETVWDWAARGVLSAIKIESKLYFEPAVLAQELAALRQPKKSEEERC
jgi:hypothetical protein